MGAAVKITRTEHTPAALRALAARCDQADQARRMLALAMVIEGMSRADAARRAGMDRQTLRTGCIGTTTWTVPGWFHAPRLARRRN